MRWLVLIGLLASACGSEDGPSCELPEFWSTASSGDGSTCQVNFFTEPEYAVYCGGATGNWDCACGAAIDDPDEFISEDLCDLEAEERACQAIERCNFPL